MSRPFAVLILLALACAGALRAQVVYGSIDATVADPSGAVVPKARVRLVNDVTMAVREAVTDERGAVLLPGLVPGSYTLELEHPDFRKFRKTQIVLSPSERLSLGEIRLELGSLAEAIQVTAEGATVQTAGGDRSGIITSEQVEHLTVINRDFAALTSLLPGVVTEPGEETQGFGGNSQYYVQGGRNTGNNITIDGLPAGDLGNQYQNTAYVSMDSVATVKIMVSNFASEFGRKPGAGIQAVTKSGGRQFHGTASFYERPNQLKANDFFNNRNGVPLPEYRYRSASVTLGGPIYIPGKFNKERKSLFFFVSAEYIRESRPQPIRQHTLPTEQERIGDFSDSRDLNGALIAVRDPAANNAPFAGNVVPASRIHPATQKYLGLFPLPNFFDINISARRFNYQDQQSLKVPKHLETYKVDYAPSDKTTIYGRFGNWWESINNRPQTNNVNLVYTMLPYRYINTSRTVVLSGTHIVSPSTFLEASAAASHHDETGPPYRQSDVERLNRKNSGATLPQLYPENNPLDLVPQGNFGGITGAPQIIYEGRFPMRGSDTLITSTVNLTRIAGSHTFKFGFYAERARNFEGNNGNFAGTMNFARNQNNPNNANHPYANALLGLFNTYTESTSRPWEQSRSTILEWFVQDNWKATRRLMLDYGVRFAWSQPYHSYRNEEAGFVRERFDPARQVLLVEPGRVGNRRVGVNPITGEVLPAEAIGAIAVERGDPFNGTVDRRSEPGYPQGMRENSGLKLAPRLGFAYDPFGKGKTAVRGGFGVFYEVRERGNMQAGLFRNPPIRLDPTIYYGHVDTFTSLPGVLFPSDTAGFDPYRPLPQTMNFSFGIQQSVGFGVVADVSYAGSLGRHLVQAADINSIPYGANYLPENLDATNGNRPLPAMFLRSYRGYNVIKYYSYAGNSNYHSLQTSANRRFSRGLLFGVSWTWAKAMSYTDTEDALLSTQVNPRVWNYGRAAYDRTHVFKFNWTYDLPRASRGWNNAFSRTVLDGWQISGIASFQSGAPMGIGVSVTSITDLSGSPTESSRTVLIGKPTLARGERTFDRYFNTEAFAPPVPGTPGNAAKDLIRGPGLNNWDISLFKNLALPKEGWRLQLRGEFYNAFNHTQFTTLDTGARFDALGNQTNARFGEITGSRAARRVQLALRLTF